MKNKRILPSFAMLIFMQLIQYFIMQLHTSFLMYLMLAVFLLNMGISVWEMHLFTRKNGTIQSYVGAYLPYLLQTGILILSDFGFWMISGKKQTAWLIFSVSILLFCALMTFVIGAARTMLYHDEKR